MATFGKTDIGGNTHTWSGVPVGDDLIGCIYTCPANCTVSKITVYLAIDVAGSWVKCGIYNNATLEFVAETEARDIDQATDWFEFSFTTPPALYKDVDYLLCVWMQNGANQDTYYDAGTTDQTCRDLEDYGSFPSTYTKDNCWDEETSIYATYTAQSTEDADTGTLPDPPSITYGHGTLEECDDTTDFVETLHNMGASDATLTCLYNDVFMITAVFDEGATDEYCYYYKDVSSISTTTYTKYMVRWKTSESASGAQAQVEFGFSDGSVQTVALGYSTTWILTVGTLTTGKTITNIRFYADDDGTDGTFYVYYDFLLFHKDYFTLPNGAYGLRFNPPPKYAVILIPARVGDITQNLGSESATISISCDLDIGTWKRTTTTHATDHNDYLDAEVFIEISHNTSSEPWQWLDTGYHQFKTTLENPNFRMDILNDEAKWSLDLLFREYRHSDASNESYYERFGLNL